MKHSIIDSNRSYNFSDYFDMNIPIDELMAYFGYSRTRQKYPLPRSEGDLSYFAGLQAQLESYFYYADPTSETALREVLVAPILLNVAVYLKIPIRIEYPLRVTHQLKGKVDYYLYGNNLLVIEAKNGELQRGFIQLAAELIAFDQWLDADSKPIYGMVTIGNIWQFAILNRATKQMTQDPRLYRVPDDLEELLRILIAILTGEESN